MQVEDSLGAAWSKIIGEWGDESKLSVPKEPGVSPWVFTFPGGWLAHRDPSILLYLARQVLRGRQRAATGEHSPPGSPA
jgi:hypothetical protein